MISVFTPTHDPRWLDECYISLKSQTDADWEWVVVTNGKAAGRTKLPGHDDPRVRYMQASSGIKGVGALKAHAVSHCHGDILLELDHDDVLMPRCVERVRAAFADNIDAVVVYSDFTHINAAGEPDGTWFDPQMGWTAENYLSGTVNYLNWQALEPTPHNVAYIWYTPNHVRAFRRTAYDEAGGYDPTFAIADDIDLLTRLYLQGDFVRIPEMLYMQRLHANNTHRGDYNNDEIQIKTVELYNERIQGMGAAWAKRRGLQLLRLTTPGGFHPDVAEGFSDTSVPPMSFQHGDSSVGVILLMDVLQSLTLEHTRALLNECYRVLSHGGLLLTTTPSTDGRGAFQNPLARSYWNENSFMYWTQKSLAIPHYSARFQVSNLRTYFPSGTHEQMQIPYVGANLVAIKDGPRQGGPSLC